MNYAKKNKKQKNLMMFPVLIGKNKNLETNTYI